MATLVAIGLALAAIQAFGLDLAPLSPATRVAPWLWLAQAALWCGACVWVWRRPGLRVWPILALALLLRLIAWSGPPALSSDVYRYAWDGRVQRAGLSPYAHPPDDVALLALRDAELHPRINRPGARTVYPPGAQLLFLALPYHLGALRLILIGLELGALALLTVLLRRLGLDPARVVLAAWAPLAIWEVGNGAHLEAALLPLLVGAALCLTGRFRGREALLGLLAGLTVAMKLTPALLLPVWARRRPWRVLGPAAAVVGGLYALWGSKAGGHVLGFLPQYVGPAEDHNIGLRRLLEAGLGAAGLPHARALAFGLCGIGLAAGAIWVLRRRDAPIEALRDLTGLWLLVLPTAFHPWYALWLLPWLAVAPRAGWMWLLATVGLSYLKYGAPGELMPVWVVPLELLPTAALLWIEEVRGT